jgi:hypothetical protein
MTVLIGHFGNCNYAEAMPRPEEIKEAIAGEWEQLHARLQNFQEMEERHYSGLLAEDDLNQLAIGLATDITATNDMASFLLLDERGNDARTRVLSDIVRYSYGHGYQYGSKDLFTQLRYIFNNASAPILRLKVAGLLTGSVFGAGGDRETAEAYLLLARSHDDARNDFYTQLINMADMNNAAQSVHDILFTEEHHPSVEEVEAAVRWARAGVGNSSFLDKDHYQMYFHCRCNSSPIIARLNEALRENDVLPPSREKAIMQDKLVNHLSYYKAGELSISLQKEWVYKTP